MSWFVPKPGGGRRRRTGFEGTLTQARQEKSVETADARSAVPDRPVVEAEPPAIPTLFEFTKRLLRDTMPRKQITIDHYESAYRLRIHEHLGHMPLDRITPAMVRDWCDQLVRRDGDRTCARKAAKTLRLILNEAVAEDLLTHNPTAGMKFERRARSAVRAGAPSSEQHRQKKPALNRPEYERLKRYAATVGVRELVMVRLLVEGILRRNELLGLRWGGYDRKRRTIAVTEGVTYAPTTGTSVGDPKTKKSNRLIVLSRDLCEVLDLYRATRDHGTDPDHYIVPGYERFTRVVDPTRPLNPDAASKQTIALISGSGLLADDGAHYTDVQGLRSSGASIADAAGVPRSIVEAQMGHAGQTTYERHYRDIANAPERFQLADVFEAATEHAATT